MLRDADAREIDISSLGPDAAATLRPGDRWPRPTDDVPDPASTGPRGARRWLGSLRPVGRQPDGSSGELLFDLDGRWRIAVGDLADPIEAPVQGVVTEVRPGSEIVLRFAGRAIAGAYAIGTPVRGRLEVAAPPGGEVRAGAIDVRRRGTILVVGARVDAEALTRARAMGVRGIVVAGLAGKERRDLIASGERQLAARHRLDPFAVLVLDGALRRPIAAAQAAIFDALAGTEVGIVIDPPALVFDQPTIDLPLPAADAVRVRTGARTGDEGRFVGLAGIQRFPGGADLEAAHVVIGNETVVVPLADLERFA